MTTEDVFKALEKQLQEHDWFYMMSDDHRVYSGGLKSQGILKATYEKACASDYRRAEALWTKYCPYHKAKNPCKS